MNVGRVEKYTPEALSVVRIIVALLFLEHGSAKLLGFPPSPHGEPEGMTLMWLQGLTESQERTAEQLDQPLKPHQGHDLGFTVRGRRATPQPLAAAGPGKPKHAKPNDK